MRLFPALGISAAVLGCGGSRGPTAAPAPRPAATPATAPIIPTAPLRYRLRAPITYDVERYDTLAYESMPGAPQISGKRAVLTLRPAGRNPSEVEIVLDSLTAADQSQLADSTVASTLGTRWQAILVGQTGPRGLLMGGRPTILAGQIEEIVRLLLPQLPADGLRVNDSWSDSTSYRVRLDAFDAVETAARTSRAEPATTTPGGLSVEAVERLSRTGSATQGGQTMALRGSGLRKARYEFSPDGWVSSLVARDSLDLTVSISPAGETIPVRWRSTLLARVRGPSPR